MDHETEKKRREASTGGPEEQEAYARAQERGGTSPAMARPELVVDVAGWYVDTIGPTGEARTPAECVQAARRIVNLAYGASDAAIDALVKAVQQPKFVQRADHPNQQMFPSITLGDGSPGNPVWAPTVQPTGRVIPRPLGAGQGVAHQQLAPVKEPYLGPEPEPEPEERPHTLPWPRS